MWTAFVCTVFTAVSRSVQQHTIHNMHVDEGRWQPLSKVSRPLFPPPPHPPPRLRPSNRPMASTTVPPPDTPGSQGTLGVRRCVVGSAGLSG